MNLRIATVKYLNALPFLHALKELKQQRNIELIEAIPSVCSNLLQEDKVDIALIPVGAISDFEKLFLISDYCISCDGYVRTVKLFSEYAMDQLQQIILDPSSRSSNLLVQILCKNHWNKPEIIFAESESYNPNLKTGFVKIGDEVFELENRFPFEFDLGNEWKIMTGLPFVFAIWVSKKMIGQDKIEMINERFQKSLLRISDIIAADPALDKIILNGYFEKNIYYEFDERRRTALIKFLELGRLHNPIV